VKSNTNYEQRMMAKFKRHMNLIALNRYTYLPQPSLSRMLNLASMPRRSTLYKIANALNVEETEVVTEWSR
jgi:transcriptional regulator with XRE-family HTH domain